MTKRNGTKQHETAVLTLSDLHFGKKTSTFSPAAFEKKLDALGKKLAQIRGLMAGYEFDKLVVFVLGDVNDGTAIYKTQPHHQAESNVEEQAEQLTDLLAPWFLEQKKIWGDVQIECVPGNHGRAGYDVHEAANWDIVAYKYLYHKLRGEMPVGMSRKTNPFIRSVSIRGHRYLLYHGHDIRSFGNIPWYGMLLRIARWNTTALAPFDVVTMGHFHSFGAWQFNRITALLSGTTVTNDDWALQSLGWESANKFWLFGCSEYRPVTWSFGLDV